MKQSRFMSAMESVANITVGLVVSTVAQAFIMWALGIPVNLHEQLIISVSLTVVSFVRSFALRRAFEAIRVRWST